MFRITEDDRIPDINTVGATPDVKTYTDQELQISLGLSDRAGRHKRRTAGVAKTDYAMTPSKSIAKPPERFNMRPLHVIDTNVSTFSAFVNTDFKTDKSGLKGERKCQNCGKSILISTNVYEGPKDTTLCGVCCENWCNTGSSDNIDEKNNNS